ncbi:winged helix-turn-helix domain-containing protein [Vibrio mexicanus]|uniref:winged helix-turn-helix domain-containing protein n=1 Tax=Vibrio mexicanus TaxID=1004326 RepID=UPI00063CA8EF|nr:winged helix-turn-helix domain-containing protein [Vibrio mexicanus]
MTTLSLEPPIYNVGGILYSPTSGVIEWNEERSQLRAREANLFHALIQSFPEVLSRTDIEKQLWKDSYATNATINQTVKALRFSLKDDQRTLIRTIPKQGYVLSTKPHLYQAETTEPTVPVTSTEVASPTIENDVAQKQHQENTEKVTTLFNATQWAILGGVSIALFVATSLGLGAKKYQRTSHQHGNNWVMFEHSEENGEPIPFRDIEQQQFALKDGDIYLICTKVEEQLTCVQR